MKIRVALRRGLVALLITASMLCQGTWALASTTGGVSGVVTDSTTGRAVADATVTAVSPSQSATTTTDNGGNFHFLTLSPDTYTVSATKSGYNSASQSGITVFADQTHTMSLGISPTLRTIANVTARAAGNLVKPGTTADVYSVNAATQQVLSGSGGGFNLNQAYSGIYSQPGVTSYIGNAGWGQVFYIRGSSYSQIGYEFDGVPVNRAFDNYQANSLSTLGQQELQVYTGGSPSGASSATLGGFINQVIKTGTYPGFGTLTGGIGGPGFYHSLTAEAGGSNPNRTFSYYVGVQGYNQHYPNFTWNGMSNISTNGLNQYGLFNGAEIATTFCALLGCVNGAPPDGGATGFLLNGPFGPCQASGANAGFPIGYTAANPGPFNGACWGFLPWNTTSLSEMFERDNVMNFHFAIPHKFDSGRDDIQLLWDGSTQMQPSSSSINDAGGLGFLNSIFSPFAPASNPGSPWPGFCGEENTFGIGCATLNSPIPYPDTQIFAPGTTFGQQVSSTHLVPYYFPSSNTNRALNIPGAPTSGIPATLKDGVWNDTGIVKGQYTKNIGSNAYARLFGYTFYSDWFIGNAPTAESCYLVGAMCTSGGVGFAGGEAGDYELDTHTRGAEFQFADQVNAQNLLRFTANYTTATVTRFNNSTFESGVIGSRNAISNFTTGNPSNPVCYNFRTGYQASCFSSLTYGTPPTFFVGSSGPTRGQAENPCGTVGGPPVTSPACVAGATWLVTVPGAQGTYNTVRPVFTSLALEDEFKPNEKLDLNLGLRLESYQYNLTNSNTPEFNYWFNEGAQVNCYDPATGLPMTTPLGPGQPAPPQPVQTAPLGHCGTAPSGQEGLHPVGGTSLCGQVIPTSPTTSYTTQDCGSLLYTALGPNQLTRVLLSPRVGATYTLSPDDVLRFSLGKYTQPTETAFEQYLDASGKRAAAFNFTQFWGLGFNTPVHDNPVQYSNNYDFSWEHRFKNSDVTFKVSPFYRDTHNQIVTVVLGPGFVSGVNLGHEHSTGLEFQLQKGDPSRDGWSGALSYTYTKSLVQYGAPPSGVTQIDYLNNYIRAFNGLTSAGGGSPCYSGGVGQACPANFAANPTVVMNPYFNMSSQPLLARDGWYQPYPNSPPSDPTNNTAGNSSIWPHEISAWVQYKHGRFAIAPNLTIVSGSYYGSPVDTTGIDPRACAQNESAATTPAGTPVPGVAGTAAAGFCDFLTAGPSSFTSSSILAIPNPYTGSFDNMGQFQQPWQANVGALIRYDVSPRVTANLTLTNLLNYCWGGSNTPWSSAFKAGTWVCGYGYNGSLTGSNFDYVGPLQGQPGYGGGFFYGSSPGSVSNGSPTYPAAFNYPFAPYSGALPFQAYLQVQIKI